ncbi:hypothetical protein BS47DRAFT_1258999, partial [Hydnum rufescens UP504]
VLCQDVLHGIHEGFFDHIGKWLVNTIDVNEFDACLIAQPHHVGYKNFAHGISTISQMTGTQHCNLQCHIAPVILGA